MRKLTSIIFIVTLFITSILSSFSPVTQQTEAKALKCSTVIEAILLDIRTIKSLFDSYEQSMGFANDPFHKAYKEDHLRHAQNDLEYIQHRLESINTELNQLATCSGYSADDIEKLTTALVQYFSQTLSQTFNNVSDDVKLKYYFEYGRSVLLITQLRTNPVYKGIYEYLFEEPSSEMQKFIANFTNNVVATFDDKIKYRVPSYDSNASDVNNAYVAMDGINSLMVQLKAIFIDLPVNKRNNAFSVDMKLNELITFNVDGLKSSLKEDGASILVRGLYQTMLQQHFDAYMPPEQANEVGTIMASGLSAFLVSTNPIMMGLAYGEMITDLNDYNVTKIKEAVAGINTDAIDSYNKNTKLVEATNRFASNITNKMYDATTTASSYKTFFQAELNNLDKELHSIYQLDPKEIKIYYENNRLFSSTPPFKLDGVTMVPLRLISDQLNIPINWNKKEQTITFETSKHTLFWGKPTQISMTIGSKTAKVGPYGVGLEVAPVVKNGITFVPVRFVTESLGLKVKWIEASQSVMLSKR